MTHPLSGTDYFMLALDSLIRRSGGTGNICHLLLRLDPKADTVTLERRLSDSPTLRSLAALRLIHRPFMPPKWKSGGNIAFVHKIPEQFSDNELTRINLNLGSAPGIGWRFYKDGVLLFTWHHALMDAHGAELLCTALGAGEPEQQLLFPKNDLAAPFAEQLAQSRSVSRSIIRKAEGSFVSPWERAKLRSPAQTGYLHKEWSVSETAEFEQRAVYAGGGMFPSIVLLAAATRAYRSTFRIPMSSPLFVPVPHDRRRKGARGPIISNQLTFLYFRAEERVTLREVVRDLLNQMQDSIASRLHSANLHFMALSRRLPLRAYLRLLAKPAGGQLASFFFSDIGQNSNQITSLFGERVAGVLHYPPNVAPPGFTLVTGRRQGRIWFTVVHDKRLVSSHVATAFLNRMQKELFSESPPSARAA